MTDTLANSLKVIAPHIEPQLISTQTLSQVEEIASFLPSVPIVPVAGFECRLGTDDAMADFLLCIGDSDRELLAGCSNKHRLSETVLSNKTWNTIRNFSNIWSNPASSLHDKITNVWLEFDVDEASSAIPEPSFFFGSPFITGDREDDSYQWAIDLALRSLLGDYLTPQVEQNLLKCFRLLPAGGKVFQIGVMLSRPQESNIVRLCVKDLPSDRIIDYLVSIGWKGSIPKLQAVIDTMSSFVDDIRLNFAVGETVFPKIGLECYCQRKPAPEPKLERFLDYLVEQQLCTPAKRQGISTWSGLSNEISARQLWCSDLLKTSSFLGDRKLSTFARSIHHIKIVYQPDKPLTAKAYLAFWHLWLDLPSPAKQPETDLQ